VEAQIPGPWMGAKQKRHQQQRGEETGRETVAHHRGSRIDVYIGPWPKAGLCT